MTQEQIEEMSREIKRLYKIVEAWEENHDLTCDCGAPASKIHECPYTTIVSSGEDEGFCNCCESCTTACHLNT